MNTHSEKHPARPGVAAVELAVCLPLLVVIALATIEACGMLHLSQNLKIATFEAARVGVVPGAEVENVEFQCETLLDNRGVKAYSITLDPADPALLNEGDYFRVTVDSNFDENALLGGFIFSNRVISQSTALRTD